MKEASFRKSINQGGTMFKRWTVVVLAAAVGSLLYLSCPANYPPRVISFSFTPASIARNDTVNIVCHATDDDGDVLTFNWSNYGGRLLTPSSTDSTVTWIADSVDGSYMVVVDVHDNRGGMVTDTANITIAAPSRVSLTVDSISTGGVVQLTWTKNKDTDFLRYEVRRSLTKGGAVSGTVDTTIINPADTSYSKSGLVANQTYYFEVTVVNKAGTSSNSNEASTLLNGLPPTPITLFDSKYIEPNTIRLIWSQNPDADFSKYEVYMSQTPGFNPDTITRVTTPSITRRVDTIFPVPCPLQKTTYYFKVVVTNSAGLSDTSNEVSAKTTAIYGRSAGNAMKLDLSMPGYAFLAAGGSGLRVFNITTPEQPAEVGSYKRGGANCLHLFISVEGETTYAYLAHADSGLVKVNATNPAYPVLADSLPALTVGWVHSVYKSGPFVYFGTYFADSSKYYFAVASADPLSFATMIQMPDKLADIFVYGNYAYVADNYGGLRVVDVWAPYAPNEISHLTFPDAANGVYLSGTVAYVAAGAAGLIAVDISQPNLPRILWTVDTPGYAQDVFVQGSYAYVADGQGGLQKIDINSAQLVMTYGIPGADIWDVRVQPGHAFLADYTSYFKVLAW
jgi:hypothetical protein